MSNISVDVLRFGLLQFGNKVYAEIELGAVHNLRGLVSRLLAIQYKNDDNSDVSGALEAAIDMLKIR